VPWAPSSVNDVRTAWITPRAIRLHATLLVLVVSFVLLARWQVARALSGNGLSWAYAFEWPLFAFYAFYVWWRLLHDDQPVRRPRRQSARAVQSDARADDERAEYNAYLASLHHDDEPKQRRPA
jgi:hypothetical protein